MKGIFSKVGIVLLSLELSLSYGSAHAPVYVYPGTFL